jgi:hypothetical protein
MANQKLTEEELQSINELQQRSQTYQDQLGRLEVARLDVEKRKQEVIEYNEQTIEMNKNLVDQLEQKYGKGTIDLQSGEFIEAQPDQQSDNA